MDIIQAITFSIAVLGAVLGIINTWHNLDKSKVKLKVIPKHAIPVGSADPRINFCIEITNLSAFPLTISEAGFMFRGSEVRASLINQSFPDGSSWPKRLEPRTSATLYSQIPAPPAGSIIKCAYAMTQCGEVVTGTSVALKQIAANQTKR